MQSYRKTKRVAMKVVGQKELVSQVQQLCTALDMEIGKVKYERCITASIYVRAQTTVSNHLGFTLEKSRHRLQHASGVVVSSGQIAKHTLVALYPGTVYTKGDPTSVASFANSFAFECSDGLVVDGSDSSLSKLVFKSCSFRQRNSVGLLSDQTWLTTFPANPIALGQQIGCTTSGEKANVCYQEIDLPVNDLPQKLRRYIPNVPYRQTEPDVLRLIALVSLRPIEAGEELLAISS